MRKAATGDTQVVRASRRLPAGVKLVWMEDWYLDQREQGCWLTHEQLGMRLGMSARTVEAYRLNLTRVGLHERIPNGPSKPSYWRSIVPVDARTRSARPAFEAVTAAREELDRAIGTWPPDAPDGRRDHALASEGPFPTPIGALPFHSRDLSREGPSVVGTVARPSSAFESHSEATSPAVQALEAEEVSPIGPESKAGEGRLAAGRSTPGSPVEFSRESTTESAAEFQKKAALELSLKVIEKRVERGILSREQADVERRRVLGL